MQAVLFETRRFALRELAAADLPALQALYEANPEYFLAIRGRIARPDEARIQFDELPPAYLGFTRRWFAGIRARTGALEGIAIVLSDHTAPGVWHVALLQLAARLHGTGAAAEVFEALERWAAGQGAAWLRLGVVQGNTRAERFWRRQGFVETRVREGAHYGERIHTVRVLVKALTAAPLSAYLALVPRDQAGSPLP